jgi:ribose transport system ATP-binding protein
LGYIGVIMFLEVQGITKQFYGNTVLSNITLGFEQGEIHAVVGENGAGKSTLIKIIGGNYFTDSGTILIDGNPVVINSQHQASEQGIHIVYQEYNLVQNMTVLDNILLGREPVGFNRLIRTAVARKRIAALAAENNISVDLDKFAGDLSSAEAKLTEILRACSHDMRILILDEPTAALDDDDVASLFQLLEAFKKRGITIIYISHRLDEVFRLCDRVTVLKDGNFIGTWKTNEINHDLLITSMVGRELKEIFPPRDSVKIGNDTIGVAADTAPPEPVLTAKNLSDDETFYDISFSLHKGEILGIGGMSGHGQRELIRSLFGVHPIQSGSMVIEGVSVQFKHPKQAVAKGLAFLSDDRRNEGLALAQPISRNISYPSMKKRSRLGIISRKQDDQVIIDLIHQLDIKLTSIHQAVQGLSGGNQQRVVLAKWLPLNPKILLFHEPTLGVDVGAKAEIYRILREFSKNGVSVIMVTSDMLELINMTDRIIVMYEGRIQAIIPSSTATEESVMAAASGKILEPASNGKRGIRGKRGAEVEV